MCCCALRPNPSLKRTDVPKRTKPSNYPEPFASQMQGREKRPLGDLFGLINFGVNLTQLAPGAVSSLRHAHTCPGAWLPGQPLQKSSSKCVRP